MSNKNFYKNKTILITGATDLLGDRLSKLLKKNCKTIRAMSNDENGLFNLKTLIEKNNLNLKNKISIWRYKRV